MLNRDNGPWNEDSQMRKMRLALEDAQDQGNEELTAEIAEMMREYKDWLAYCYESHCERELNDARHASYWEARI